MESIFDRVKFLMEQKGVTVNQLAKDTGISRNTINGWFWKGQNRKGIRLNALTILCDYFGVSIDYLKRGSNLSYSVDSDDSSSSIYAYIPEYEFTFGAGESPEPTFSELQSVKPVPYLESYFRKLNVKPSDCRLVKVKGDSMQPLIMDNDRIMIECVDVAQVYDGRIYALVLKSGLMVKMLYKDVFNRTLTIHSVNPLYKDSVLSEDEANNEVLHIYRVLRIERELTI